MKQTYFLATTALEEFWDLQKPIVFLSPGCLRFNRRKQHETFSYQIFQDIWQHEQHLLDARIYIDALYQRMLIVLAEAFNTLHQKKYTKRYWEILIGPWLLTYLSILYDRFTLISRAYATDDHLSTIGLTLDNIVIPKTTVDFSNYLATDIYNLQVYTHILAFLNIHFEQRHCDVDALLNKMPAPSTIRSRFKKKLLSWINRFFMKAGYRSNIILYGLSLSLSLKFLIKSACKIMPIISLGSDDIIYSIDKQKRNFFQTIHQGASDFERCLIDLLPNYLPQCFVEGYSALETYANQLNLKANVIFAPNAWYYSESFKWWAASQQEQQALLVGHQHGGCYGTFDYNPAESYEVAITDRFYTWGWDQAEYPEKIIPLTALKLKTLKKKRRFPQEIILLGCTTYFRHLYRYTYSVTTYIEYHNMRKTFLQHLHPKLYQKLRVRLHHEDNGWDVKERIADISPDIIFQPFHFPFRRALNTCKIYIADHLSTTYLESFAANIPTLLVCHPKMTPLREDVQPYYQDLKDCGIFFHDPIEAADLLTRIESDVDAWWFDHDRQSVIKKFRERFCRAASPNLSEWTRELVLLAGDERSRVST